MFLDEIPTPSQIKLEFEKILSKYGEETLRQEASLLYWSREDIPPSHIKNAYISIVGFQLRPTPLLFKWNCPGCSRVLSYATSTRDRRDRLKSQIRSGSIAYVRGWKSWKEETAVCTDCFKKRRDSQRLQEKSKTNSHYSKIDTESSLRTSLPYPEYLKTDHWLNTRKKAYKRAEYRCQLCNRGDVELNAHHRTYERLGCERDSDVIVLCRFCHEKFHDILPKEDKR